MTHDLRRALPRALPLTLALALAAALPAAAAAADMHFQVPDGWVDLAAGHPLLPGMSANAAALVTGNQVYAVDPAGRADGYLETMVVRILPQAIAADDRALQPFINGFAQSLHAAAPLAELAVAEKGIVEVQGVPAIRVVADITAPRRNLRSLIYVISGGQSSAFIVYTAEAQQFAHYLPMFEANLKTTQGIGQPPFRVRLGSWLLHTPLGDLPPDDRVDLLSGIGKGVGLLVAAVIVVWYQKRKKAAAARPPV